MGVFGAFNYGLHLFGGYLGGRFLTNRNLFVGGMALHVSAARASRRDTGAVLHGLALFLTGSGLNVTCINMMLTQRFTPDDPRREGAFLWNYAGMNVGFFVGFTVAGHFQADSELLEPLYLRHPWQLRRHHPRGLPGGRRWPIATRHCSRRHGPFREAPARRLAILTGLVPLVWFLLQRPGGTETLIKAHLRPGALTLVWLDGRPQGFGSETT